MRFGRVVSSAGFVVLGLLALLVVLPGFVDWTGSRDRIGKALAEATGRTVVVNGDVDLVLLPKPAFELGDVRVLSRSATGASADEDAKEGAGAQPPLMEVEKLTARLKLRPLLFGSVHVTSLGLSEGRLDLAALPLGPSLPGQAPGEGVPHGAEEGPAAGLVDTVSLALDQLGNFLGTVQMDRVSFERVDVEWSGERPFALEGLSGSARLLSSQGPFNADLTFRLAGQTQSMRVHLGRLEPGAAVPVDVEMRGVDLGSKLAITGSLSAPTALGEAGAGPESALEKGPPVRSFAGRLEMRAASFLDVLRGPVAGTRALETAGRGGTPQAVHLTGALLVDQEGIGLEGVRLQIGSDRFEGQFRAPRGSLAGRGGAPAILRLTSIEEATLETAKLADALPLFDRPSTMLSFFPRTRIVLASEAVRLFGVLGGEGDLSLDFDRGRMTSVVLQADGPPVGALTLTLTPRYDDPATVAQTGEGAAPEQVLEGQLSWTTRSPAAVLAAYDIALRQGPGRGESLSLESPVRFEEGIWWLDRFDLVLDRQTYRGTLALTPGDIPSVGLSISGQTFDFDAYGLTDILLERLREPDINRSIKLAANQVTFLGQTASNVRVDVDQEAGAIVVSKLDFNQVAGAGWALTGAASPEGPLELSGRYVVDNGCGLWRRIAQHLPAGSRSATGCPSIFPEQGRVEIKGGEDGLQTILRGPTPGTFSLSLGPVDPGRLFARPVPLSFSVDQPLLQAKGTGLVALRQERRDEDNSRDAGAVWRLEGEATGADFKALAQDMLPGLAVVIPPGAFKFDGMLRHATTGFQPEPFRLSLPDAQIDVALRRQPLSLTDRLLLEASAPREALERLVQATVPAWRDGLERPDETLAPLPILEVFRQAFDFQLSEAPLAQEDGLPRQPLEVNGTVGPQRLRLENVQWPVPGGQFNGNGALAFSPNGADLRLTASFTGAGLGDRFEGLQPYLDGTGVWLVALQSTGGSVRALMENLEGESTLTLSEGQLKGFDLAAFSDRAAQATTRQEIHQAAAETLIDGNTRLTDFLAEVVITKGQARSVALEGALEGGSLTGAVSVDLVAETMEGQAKLFAEGTSVREPILFDYEGALAGPRRVINVNQLAENHAEALIAARLEEGLEDQPEPSAQATPASEATGELSDGLVLPDSP